MVRTLNRGSTDCRRYHEAMLRVIRFCTRLLAALIAAPVHFSRTFLSLFLFNPRLGRLNILSWMVAGYVIVGLILVYPFAFLWGVAGQAWIGKVLDYANERSLGTAIHDSKGRFVGILDPHLDSEEDFNYTGKVIELPGYIAYPDHKSLHVSTIPEHYWNCLVHQEDRHIRSLTNPWGIDLLGYLKIPVTTLQRSFSSRSLQLGSGGSTISMQLARIFFKTPPSANESILSKIERKLKEWWLAPVIQRQLVRGNDMTRLKLWAANHFPLAQRTGGGVLHGVEQTSLIVFGVPAEKLTVAQQYVLAAAVNRPIILLDGSEKLNRYRSASWKRVAGTRAQQCADALIGDDTERTQVKAELTQMAENPPDPSTPPEFVTVLAEIAPHAARPAGANPVRRANTLIPAVKYGVRDEIRNKFGFGWRSHVRGVKLTLDTAENLTFRKRVLDELIDLQARFKGRINPRYSLNVSAARGGKNQNGVQVPDIVIAAADANGAIVRYFESNYTAAYFGSSLGRDPDTGKYDPERESRFIASVAKMAAAVAIANEDKDAANTGYLDIKAPATGLESCRKGRERRLRRADVAFACSLNSPIEWRLRQIRAGKLRQLVRAFSLAEAENGPPLAKSLVVGQVAGSPRTVHRIAGTLLAALRGETASPGVMAPSLLNSIDRAASPEGVRAMTVREDGGNRSANPVHKSGRKLLEALLSAPLCNRHGTLRRISDWCARKRPDVKLHFAKTGTRGTGALEPGADDTVDLWVAGGIQFATGPAYSYVVLIGTGNPSQPWARELYSGVVAEPLLRLLLEDLAALSARKGQAARAAPLSATDREEVNR